MFTSHALTSRRAASTFRRAAAVALGATVTLATTAHAGDGCTAVRIGTHDLDQVRYEHSVEGALGLPNGGLMYCVPTTWVGWMLYLNQHGYPFAASVAIPLDWTDPANYNLVTHNIEQMGVHMQTDPTGGTGYADGIYTWLADRGLGDAFYDITHSVDWFDQETTYHGWVAPGWMAHHIRQGHLLSMSIGWSVLAGSINVGDGSHTVGAPVTLGECGEILVLYNDPGSNSAGDTAWTQGHYTYNETTMSLVTDLFKRGDSPVSLKTVWQLDEYPPLSAIFKGYRALAPVCGAILPPALTSINLVIPYPIDEEPEPQTISIDLPIGVIASAIEPHPSGNGYVLSAVRDDEDTATLYWIDPVEEIAIPIPGIAPEPGPFTLDRFGNLWVQRANNEIIERWSLIPGDGSVIPTPELLDAHPTPIIPEVLVAVDDLDAVMSIGTSFDEVTPLLNFEIQTPNDELIGSWTIPATGDLAGGQLMAAIGSDVESLWVASTSSARLRRFTLNPETGRPTLANQFVPAGIGFPQALAVNGMGRLLIVDQDGAVHELSHVAETNTWHPTTESGFAGVPELTGPVARLSVTRRRSNVRYDIPIEQRGDLPERRPQDVFTLCPADLDHDGIVGFTDLLAVIANWGVCELECPGDADEDGDSDFDDVLKVLASWGPCP